MAAPPHDTGLASIILGVMARQCPCPETLKRREPARAITSEGELALANAMREFHTRERNGGRAKGLEGKHRCAAALDRSMVLFDDVVEIPATANHDGPPFGISCRNTRNAL